MKKLTLDEIREEFEKRSLILDSTHYENRNMLLDCHDEDGYKYSLTIGSVKDKRTVEFVKFGKQNRNTIYNLSVYIKSNNGKCEILSKEYETAHNYIDVKCECGNEYSIKGYHFLQHKKFKCNDCCIIKRSEKRISNKMDDTISKIKEYGYIPLLIKTRNNIHIEDVNGYRYKTTIDNLKDRVDGIFRFYKNNPHTIYNMLLYLKTNNINIEMVNKKPRTINVREQKIEWYCIECGNIFKATWEDVANKREYRSQRHRCSKCAKSKSNLEYKVEEYLKYKDIEYISQKRFNDCRNIIPLPFDFYLPKYNICVEVHGSQHYYENKVFQQTLEDRKRVDKIKEDYCLNNNIGYIAIPFWEIYNKKEEKETYKEIINNILGQK